MEAAKLVLEYFKVLTTPFLTFATIWIAIYTFKEPVRGILSKLSTIKLPGGAELRTTQSDNINEEAIKLIEPSRWMLRDLFKSADATPDEINARKRELLAFQGRLVALEVGMRQVVALSQNIDHDVKEGILSVCRHFRENRDQAAKSFSDTYSEYDLEMAKILVDHIAESLESFLPIRLSTRFSASSSIGGAARGTVSRDD